MKDWAVDNCRLAEKEIIVRPAANQTSESAPIENVQRNGDVVQTINAALKMENGTLFVYVQKQY
jgi:hypothetical protein